MVKTVSFYIYSNPDEAQFQSQDSSKLVFLFPLVMLLPVKCKGIGLQKGKGYDRNNFFFKFL